MNYFLIGIGIFLISVNLIGMSKKIDFKGIFKGKSMESDEKDLKILELRREFSEKILELELEINKIKTELSNMESKDIKKAKEVKKLIDEGLTVEMISEKLKTSREEIILLKNLY
ncbi:MAG: hypothetical protein LIR50_07075 [Bacillota bacterium]|nr:hypothetical protein [Bacillota bacterium]